VAGDQLPARIQAASRAIAPFRDFFTGPIWSRRSVSTDRCDFAFGDPQEFVLSGYVEAIVAASIPDNPASFAYKGSDETARLAIAASLRTRLGVEFDADDILLTKGAASALAIILQTVVSPGDEVVYVSPLGSCTRR
jgi:aspartate aminotransferase